MNIRQAFKMAWKSIWGKKGRAILTMLGIIIGIASVMTIVSAISGYADKMMEQFEAMGTNRISLDVYNYVYVEDENGNWVPQGKDYFPDIYAYCNGMKDLIVGVTPNSYFNATMVYGTKNTDTMRENFQYDERGNPVGERPPSFYYGSDQYGVCGNLKILRGRDLTQLDIKNYNQVMVMGSQAAKTFFGTANPVGKTVQLNNIKFEVVGVYDSRMKDESSTVGSIDNFVVVPYTAKRVLGGDTDSSFTVVAKNVEDMEEIVSRLNGFLKGLVDQNSGGFYVQPENQGMVYMNQTLGMIGGVLAGVAAISLMVGGIGIMNIMLVTVTERTREIGIRRAIGAQRSSIVTQFLIEAAMLCGIGGLIGMALGTGGCMLLGNMLFQMTIYPSAPVTAGAFGLSVLLGIIFGCYPAVKASKLQPVEALRAE